MLTIALDSHEAVYTILPILVGIIAVSVSGWLACAYNRIRFTKKMSELSTIQEELERLKQFPVNYPHSIIHITFDGEVLFANPTALKLHPEIEEKGFNHPILSGLDEIIGKALIEKDKDHILRRELQYGGAFYDQNVATITWGDKKTLAIYCYDTTKHKIFEKQLQITKDAADVANRAKGDFLANISHELRTPMNGIIGLSELLIGMDLNEEQKELADAVNSSSRNLLILLNDILDLSKIEAKELTLENIPFNVKTSINQTVDLLKPISSRKGVILDSVISPTMHERIIGDPARLQQIMNNLISNAIKFTEEGYVRIDVTSKNNEDGEPELQIRVEDTGIGIPEDKQESIFQKFTQADVSTARKYGGTGLGLSITKELIRMMNGEISVNSIEGKGTTFYVNIPIKPAGKETEITENNSITSPSINTNAKVLVVDDHPINLLFMRKVLKKLGFKQTDEANGGREAIEMTKENSYELILMDCQMPDIDGFEASTIIRESEEHIGDIKIIAVTADAMKGAKEKCIDSGMNDYISKPVDVEKLKSVLSLWLPSKTVENTRASRDNKNENKEEKIENSVIMDWERLDMFTDGDPEEEKSLIDMFIELAEETLETLKEQTGIDDKEEWKKTAHKLKGSAANLGAADLSDKCEEAEQSYKDDDKTSLLANILDAYGKLKNELKKKNA